MWFWFVPRALARHSRQQKGDLLMPPLAQRIRGDAPRLQFACTEEYSRTNMVGATTKSIGGDPFVEVFATPTLAALLSEFALHPDHPYFQGELVDRVEGSLYLVQRELKRLERAGLVSREARGRRVEYRYNSEHPGAAGIRNAMLATIALSGRLREAMANDGRIDLAFIFGSMASGEAVPTSDLDVFVIGRLGLRDLASTIMPVARQIGREPNIVVMNPDEFSARVRQHDHFVTTVLESPKLWLVGDDAELERLSRS